MTNAQNPSPSGEGTGHFATALLMKKSCPNPGGEQSAPWQAKFFWIVFLSATLALCGCTQLKQGEVTRQPLDAQLQTRNNAASLLYDLLGNEKNVSKILIIKRNSEELGRLIKAISESTAAAHKQMDGLAASDATLNLRVTGLPAGEKAARAAAAKTKEHELLSTSGKEFELNLLLTQAEALGYASELATIAAKNSQSPEQIRQFALINRDMKDLHAQVLKQIQQITPAGK